MDSFRERAKAFLARPIPHELKPHYVAGSLADMMIANYASGHQLDSEALELVEIAALESAAAAGRYQTEAAKAYFRECSDILTEIAKRVS